MVLNEEIQKQCWKAFQQLLRGPQVRESSLGGYMPYDTEMDDSSYYLSEDDIQAIERTLAGEEN